MGLTWNSLEIPGVVKPWAPDPWDLQSQVYSQFGQPGSGELDGGRTGRSLVIPMHLIGTTPYGSYAALTSMIEAIEAKIGQTGTLVEASGIAATYRWCKLKAVALDKAGPLPPNSHIGWTHHLTLTFRQLRP